MENAIAKTNKTDLPTLLREIPNFLIKKIMEKRRIKNKGIINNATGSNSVTNPLCIMNSRSSGVLPSTNWINSRAH